MFKQALFFHLLIEINNLNTIEAPVSRMRGVRFLRTCKRFIYWVGCFQAVGTKLSGSQKLQKTLNLHFFWTFLWALFFSICIFHYSTKIPSGFSAVGHPIAGWSERHPNSDRCYWSLKEKDGNERSGHFGKKMTFELQLFVKITGGMRVFLF